jgi:hypothetical protein
VEIFVTVKHSNLLQYCVKFNTKKVLEHWAPGPPQRCNSCVADFINILSLKVTAVAQKALLAKNACSHALACSVFKNTVAYCTTIGARPCKMFYEMVLRLSSPLLTFDPKPKIC